MVGIKKRGEQKTSLSLAIESVHCEESDKARYIIILYSIFAVVIII